ncbi:MAG TPA: hypothetical protein VMX57_09705, partial [Planctomycetota bacterium]|nr:hypothetical protein [Planctomycetota bacterium]
QRGVFTVDPGTLKARFVPLETGITSGDLVEVVKPELSGVVVSIGQHLLGEDTTVVIPTGVPTDTPKTDKPETETPKTDAPSAPKSQAPQPTPAAAGDPS